MNAAHALYQASEEMSELFQSMDNQYMKERAVDLKDVTHRMMRKILHPEDNSTNRFNKDNEMIILAAKDLLPSETIQMDKSKILAIVTCEGTANSHTVIIAQSLNIPAIISLGDLLDDSLDGQEVIVDGELGNIYIDPDEVTIET